MCITSIVALSCRAALKVGLLLGCVLQGRPGRSWLFCSSASSVEEGREHSLEAGGADCLFLELSVGQTEQSSRVVSANTQILRFFLLFIHIIFGRLTANEIIQSLRIETPSRAIRSGA